jgi:Zn-dependent protease with chaperone function
MRVCPREGCSDCWLSHETRTKVLKKKIVLLIILLLVPTTTAVSAPSIVDLALQEIGPRPVEEMKRRILSLAMTVFGPSDFEKAIASLPKSIRESRITKGKLHRKLERLISTVLDLHDRSDQFELFVYQHEFPFAMIWKGCILVVSDSLTEALYDGEIVGIIAHEMAYAYFMTETVAAKQN